MSYAKRFFLLVSVLIATLLFTLTLNTPAQAQNPEITYGSTTLGKLDVGVPFTFFGFSGQAGDLVTVRLVSFDDVFQPTLSLVAPTGQQLVFSWRDVTAPGNHARVDVLLPQDGTYNVQVGTQNGAEGQFLLRLDGVNVNDARSALPGDAFLANFTADNYQQLLRVEGSLNAVQMLEFEGNGGQFSAAIHGANGALLGVVTSNPQGLAYFALPPNDATYTVLITNADIIPQTVQLSIGEGDAVQTFQTSNEANNSQNGESIASASTGACRVTTGNGGTNLRTGPGTNYPVLTTLPGQSNYIVSGQNSGWYAISHQGGTGWLFGGVTTLEGACSGVAVISAPSAPTTGAGASGTTSQGSPAPPPNTGGNPSGGNPPGGGSSGGGAPAPQPTAIPPRATAVPPQPTAVPPQPTAVPPQPTPIPAPTQSPPGGGGGPIYLDPVPVCPDFTCDIP